MLSLPSAGSFVRAGVVPTALLLLGACALFGRSESTLPAHMFAHGAQAGQLQTAMLRGDLDGAREPARWLAEHEEHPELPQGVLSPAEDMRAFARSVVRTASVEHASRCVAEVGLACGRCHSAVGAGPLVDQDGMPTTGEEPAQHMMRHLWAADHMWDGLVAPSDRSWVLGATALSEDPLFTDPTGYADPAVRKLAREVHALGVTARNTPVERRAGIYGRLVFACAECHSLMGATPAIGAR